MAPASNHISRFALCIAASGRLIIFAAACILSTTVRSKALNLLKWLLDHQRVVFIAMLIWQGIVFITLLVSYTSWDPAQTAVEAVYAAHDPGKFSWYLSSYPNNRFLSLIEYVPAWLNVHVFDDHFSDFAMMNIVAIPMQILNIMVIDACILWVRHLLAKYSRTAAGIGFLLMSLLLGCSCWIMIPYTDTLSLPFSILLISTTLVILEPHHTDRHASTAPAITRTILLQFLLLGCAASLAYAMKPSTVIPAIVFAIIWFILNMGKRLLTVFLPTMLTASLGFILVLVPVTSAEHAVFNINDTQAVPMTHFMMMGLKGHGGFDAQDTHITGSLPTKQAKEQVNLQQIRSRIHDYGPAGYLTFLLKKSWYTTAEGTLGYGWPAQFVDSIRNEDRGANLLAVSHNNPIVRSGFGPLLTFQDFFLDHNPTNRLYKLIMQTFYIPLIAGMLLFTMLVYRRRKFTNTSVWLALSLFGGFLFLMLFESGTSRYLIQFLPLIVMLSGMGWATWKESGLTPFLVHQPDTTGGQ
ncbi:hypothetical protein BTIS_1584 [Bifidobacterium tissieri]|uniref:Glycosyltransferase RgtA/B/C/D-like domain-containing protein n=1 Tax=Bifidobacterium tissieri TaxID=1630162 RepID=A0A261FDH0_9BIFI|nr:hypothetical protein BTIS_1584 [Bifidobacterium tissieri]